MPLGGLKWKDELEPIEFKKVKKEVQVLGIDDAPFTRKDKEVKIAAVLTRGAKLAEEIFHSSITRDGLDATDKIIELVKGIERESARAIILDGVNYGGFNIVDIQRLFKETYIPVIAFMSKKPDHAAMHKALRELDQPAKRKEALDGAGKLQEIKLDEKGTAHAWMAGIGKDDAKDILKQVIGKNLVPEPIRAAHAIAKGDYTKAQPKKEETEQPHIKAYNFVKDTHQQYHRVKNRYIPGFAGEIFSFLFAVLIAYLFIQGLGWVLGTSTPLVVVESESMVHDGNWQQWHLDRGLDPSKYGFPGGMGVGDIILVKGDDPKDIGIGDVIIYTKYDEGRIGGEPIIHRVVGVAELNGDTLTTEGAARLGKDSSGNTYLVSACSDQAAFSLNELRNIYSTDSIEKVIPGISDDLDNFRVFITKGDNNDLEDQCKTAAMISYPVHEKMVLGRAKFDIPYLGYVKLGLVCAFNGIRGNMCNCRCWWPADHPKCCKNG